MRRKCSLEFYSKRFYSGSQEYTQEEFFVLQKLKSDLSCFRAKVYHKTEFTTCPASIFVEGDRFACAVHADEYIASHVEDWEMEEEDKIEFTSSLKEQYFWKSSHMVLMRQMPYDPKLQALLSSNKGVSVEGFARWQVKEGNDTDLFDDKEVGVILTLQSWARLPEMADFLMKDDFCRIASPEERENLGQSSNFHYVSYWRDLSEGTRQLVHWLVDGDDLALKWVYLESLLPQGVNLKSFKKENPFFLQFQALRFDLLETMEKGSQEERFRVPTVVLPHSEAYEKVEEEEERK